jgi:CheY-like chemotaxis protein
MQRVFVMIVGFTGTERHALNTIFRLSQDGQSARDWSYEPWFSDSPAEPRLALIDGSSPDASEALTELEELGGIGILWVGSISPAKACSSFQRPIHWPALLSAMDDYLEPSGELDVDFGDDTWPSVLETTGSHMFGEGDKRRVLLADADAQTRLYLRTKFASFGITDIDEAGSFAHAQDLLSPERLKQLGYDAVIVDLDLPGGDPWRVMSLAGNARLKLVIQNRLSFATRMTAKVNRCNAASKPLDPSRLNELLNDFL